MSDEAAESWPVRAYVEPIRSVLFVDDQFPTYSEPESGSEKERARALWLACRERGWQCDVDNATDWASPAQQQRLTSSDLLVLDYHLAGSDPTPALSIIAGLAATPSPNLVVVYTAETDLEGVLDQVAAFARGIDRALVAADLGDVADLEGSVDWSREALRSYLRGQDVWKGEFVKACREEGLDPKVNMENGRALVEKDLSSRFGAPRVETPRRIESIGANGSERWLQCGNLFVAIIGKSKESADEAKTLLDGLTAAVRAWNPSWLACLIALARRAVNDGAFRDDLALPNDLLQRGLIHYVKSAEDQEERGRRGRQVAADLVRRRFEAATTTMGDLILSDAPAVQDPPSVDMLLHANAFLCAEKHERHHLRVGTVFRSEDSSQYWVCVTPACDMVPRPRPESINPWEASLGDARVMTAVWLDTNVSAQTAVSSAEAGRYLFFEDFSATLPVTRAAVVFNLSTNDPNPKVEHMFAGNLGRKDPDGKVTLLRMRRGEDGKISIHEETAVVVCQLRAPYAERLAHIVGGHVSRIGVDFLSTKKRDAK